MAAKTRKSGSIYFIYDAKAEAIKIGYSTNVTERLSTLQTASSTKLQLLATIPGSVYDEQRLHTKFQRMHGEWFHVTPDLLSFIQQRTNVVVPLPGRPHAASANQEQYEDIRMPTWQAKLHILAAIEITAALILLAHYYLVQVILPLNLEIFLEGTNFWSFTAIYGFVCIWALTYRHRNDAYMKRVPKVDIRQLFLDIFTHQTKKPRVSRQMRLRQKWEQGT